MDLDDLKSRILQLLPEGTTPTREALTFGPVLTLHFDSQCAGNIERSWPNIFKLCEECHCNAVLIATDVMTVRSVLDTASGAPNYSTENELEVRLVLTKVREMEVAA